MLACLRMLRKCNGLQVIWGSFLCSNSRKKTGLSGKANLQQEKKRKMHRTFGKCVKGVLCQNCNINQGGVTCKTRRCNIFKNETLNHQMAVLVFLISCLYSTSRACYCFIKSPTITGVLHVPILLAYFFCNHLAENLMAEANFEMFVFSYCVSAPKAEDAQSDGSGLPLS